MLLLPLFSSSTTCMAEAAFALEIAVAPGYVIDDAMHSCRAQLR